ncbi:tRNA (adenosine(37)-N6)-threonylcarbamoyltransferase complex ATPase subunit type 1 TsaE [Ostreibacterium oceani]|uniref:tRNA threonylcarbamoyladenosine biosynthesis protein TsaE n=1 Tax=Ostreibacterium oceani TaxID=2654998 RepID=A0A6N7EVI9_9GAMM|nr:tRNA (adenosine(37)-N6)-threonylcarbamoyltransferase complex ATPase subunit type 1 TsaE [Ostreibacterium oceani]MPV86492.1 tRNA (adenosine(37)-N6)-threonylcarbamoyltransferase complex ATPase subunit type 1 TsaE [Ostreibacterium oceani]
MQSHSIDITDISQLAQVAKQLSHDSHGSLWIYLIGDLGAGKTTFSQLFIQAKDYSGIVNSPTYAIMNEYDIDNNANNSNSTNIDKPVSIIHCDLYRLGSPEELYEIGLIDMVLEKQATCLVEWPEKGRGVLPRPDIQLHFQYTADGRRTLTITR